MTGLEQLLNHILVDVTTLRLAVRFVRAADADALVPVETEPVQRLENLLVALLRVALRVGVLDAEHELAADVLRVRPVEQGGSDEPDVRGAGGRRAETNTNL